VWAVNPRLFEAGSIGENGENTNTVKAFDVPASMPWLTHLPLLALGSPKV